MAAGYKAALNRFEKAVREQEMIGCQHPESWDRIQKEYEEAKRALILKLQYRELSLTGRDKRTPPNPQQY